jgi:hypothetical protein
VYYLPVKVLIVLVISIPQSTNTESCSLSNRSPGALRMKRMRDRRQRGFRCYLLEVSEADIDALVARGFLDRMRRHEPGSVERAITGLLRNFTACDL